MPYGKHQENSARTTPRSYMRPNQTIILGKRVKTRPNYSILAKTGHGTKNRYRDLQPDFSLYFQATSL